VAIDERLGFADQEECSFLDGDVTSDGGKWLKRNAELFHLVQNGMQFSFVGIPPSEELRGMKRVSEMTRLG
jgi:hypothetical protein